MPRRIAFALVSLSTIALLAAATPADAVVMGTKSTLGHYAVRLVGNGNCSGVVIARRAVATAAHCADGMRVIAGGRSFGIAAISRSAVLDDGRHVSVSGDAAILKLATPLPPEIEAATVGEGVGNIFTIAGYGTTSENWRGSFGSLHEAVLVPAELRALVDPNRSGPLSASACFGDSGGPVMQGDVLVGIITRAAHPSPRIACGHLTRWAPITAGAAGEAVVAAHEPSVAEPRSIKRQRQARHAQPNEAAQVGLFSSWFAPKVAARRALRHKQAQR